ncbi:ATP dependent DNA ligase [Burkholderia sp. MR1-5-21]
MSVAAPFGWRYRSASLSAHVERQVSTNRTRAMPQRSAPFRNGPNPERDHEYLWLAPECVVEVAFHDRTRSGKLRHVVFRAFPSDKIAQEVTFEPVIDDFNHRSRQRAHA